MIEDPVFYLAAVPAVLVVGLSKGGFGGSLALLGMPLMAMVIPPLQAAGIMLPILVAMDAVAISAYRRTFDRRALSVLIPAGIVGITIGGLTATYVSSAHVRLIVGAVGFLFVMDYVFKGRKSEEPKPHNTAKGAFCGTVAGFTSFVAHAGGPPFQLYVVPLRLEPRLFAGTAVMFFTAMNAVKLIPYFALGQFTTQNLTTSAVLLPVAPIGVYAGVQLIKVIPKKPFYRIIYALVFLVSIRLIWQGLTEMNLL